LCLVWSAVASQPGIDFNLLPDLCTRLEECSKETNWDWFSLILQAEPEERPEQTDWVDNHDRVTVLRVPEKVHKYWDDLQAGLELALGAFHV
jgi:hypothetical protein